MSLPGPALVAAGVVIGATIVGFVVRLVAARRPAEVHLTITRNALPPREPAPTLDRSDPVAVRPMEPAPGRSVGPGAVRPIEFAAGPATPAYPWPIAVPASNPGATPVAVPVATGDDPVLRHLLATATTGGGAEAPGVDAAGAPADPVGVAVAVGVGVGAPPLRALASSGGPDEVPGNPAGPIHAGAGIGGTSGSLGAASGGWAGDAGEPFPADGHGHGASAEPDGAVDPAETGEVAASGPCATERRLLAEVTAIVARARALHEELAAQQRRMQRDYDAAMARVDEATLAMDGRRVLEEKAEAQRRFREARLAARDPVAIEAAAAAWLSTINQLNLRVRDAQRVAAIERRRLTRLVAEIEAGTTRVDGARIALESAEVRMREAREAREALAACEEMAATRPSTVARASGAAAQPVGLGADAPPPVRPVAPEAASSDVGAIGQETADVTTDLEELRLVQRAPVTVLGRIMDGDDGLLQAVAAELGGGSPEEAHHWNAELTSLRDALAGAAIDAVAIEPPGDHPFWSAFSGAEAHEIAVALASLGYRFDGRDGFAEGRVPATRDLALAIGYAGLDPLRIRRWPTASELQALLRGTRVAGAEFVAAGAPNLTLGEMIDLLGQRATELTALWDAWGRVRPLLARRAG